MEDEEFEKYLKKHMMSFDIETLLEFFGSYKKIKEFIEFIHEPVPIENKLTYLILCFNIYKVKLKEAKDDEL